MRFLARAIVEHITTEAVGERTYRYVLPSYPSALLVAVGRELEEALSRRMGRRVQFVYGIACRLGEAWRSGSAAEAADLALAEARGWYNADDNLTSLRNRVRDPEQEDTLVTVLAGYDHIDDRASLQDFFQLDDDAVWTICLRRSFRRWVEWRFADVLDPEDEAAAIRRIADGVLAQVYTHGLADLVGISAYLEGLDLTGVSSGAEAYRLVLGDLRAFHLPPMVGLARARGNRTLASYIRQAQEFANYGRFLEATARRRALEAIDRFMEDAPQEPEAELLGEFGSLGELAASLRRYIAERSEADRTKLLTADFPYIHNEILGARGDGSRPRKSSVRRLRGVAPEVFLRAMWLTLGEWRSERRRRRAADEVPERILIRSLVFRHDFDAGEADEDDGVSADDRAREFLRRALGGIDAWLGALEVETGEGAPPVRIESALCPTGGGSALAYQRKDVGMPYLQFEVMVASAGRRVRRQFRWYLPQEHGTRLLEVLYLWALEGFQRGGNALPAYAVPHMAEVFLARDVDEVTRVLGVAVGSQSRRVADLLTAAGIESDDPAFGPLLQVSLSYQGFLRAVEEQGFFAALQGPFDDLRVAYQKACLTLLERGRESVLQPLLLKAFYVVDAREATAPQWKWQTELECAVATPLHPAVLDMIRQQHTFLAESFGAEASQELARRTGRPFSERVWDRATDLARIERPVFGTLRDSAGALDSRVRSYGYFHLVGQCRAESAQLSARLLLEYEDEDDGEEISDSELFGETRSSRLVYHTLMDYRALHAHADDGIAVGAYCGREIQPVVAGIDAFLREVLGDTDRGNRPYGLQVTVFSTGRDDSAVTRWLNAWRDRWQQAELTESTRHYEHCRIAIAYRVVEDQRRQEHLAQLVGETPLAVMFFTDFVEAGTDRFEDLGPSDLSDVGYRQFPVLEKACCAVHSGGRAAQRERVLSHARFGLATLQAEVMARVSRGNVAADQRHVVVSRSDFGPWEEVMAAAHQSCGWVVCIDPAVDDQLLRQGIPEGEARREIIGFGAGVGASGESNYTVSTEQYSLADVRRRLGQQLSARLGPWEPKTQERVAERLVAAASGMAGLSMVKATGPSEYVRDYAAYAALRALLPRDPDALCDEIVSLDAFHHWFDNGVVKSRPDLLRLRVKAVEGHLEVEAQVVECKLAQSSEEVLREASEQVRHGLERLVERFRPRPVGTKIGVGDRPDQRYWWMQLHRLIATRASTSWPKYHQTLVALERMAEGLFAISWQGAVVAFWTDVEGETTQRATQWQFDIDGDVMTVPAFIAGKGVIPRVCLDGLCKDLFAGVPVLRRSSWAGPAASAGAPASEAVDEAAVRGEKAEPYEATAPMGASRDDRVTLGLMDEARAEPAQAVAVVSDGRVVERVLLGCRVSGGQPVYWEFGHEDLPNRHILVFGASGTGKTYTIQALLSELAKAGQNALIVDYTNGFTTNQLDEVVREKLRPKQHMVRREPLPINPFRKQADVIDDLVLDEDPSITAQRVAGVFSEVYQLGDQQRSALYRVIRDGIAGSDGPFGLEALAEGLEELHAAGGPLANPAASVLSKIRPFIDMHPFGREDPESWESLYGDTESRCHIIQLAGYSKDVQRLITEFALVDLYRYYRANGSTDRPRVVVLDEIQNLDHRLESPLGQMLTEGRKFGISLVLATQTLSSLDRDARDRLFQASHKLFFKPADTELPSFAQILANVTGDRSEEWVERLSRLSRGECYSLGPTRNEGSGKLDMTKYHKIRITSLDERY